MWAKQSTAATLIVGPILDSTGAEYASAVIGDLSISKNGGTLTALAAAATLTHIANGQYTLVMTTGNLDTLGRLQITCNKSTYQMPPIGLVVVPAMVFDSMVLGTDVLQGDTVQIGGDTQSATDLKDFADAGYDPATNTVVAALDSAATAALVDLIWDEPLTGATHNVATSSGKRLRQTTAFQQIDSTVVDAAATATTFITGLTSSVDDFYNDSMLVFTDGALAGQVRAIYDYVGATKTIILEEALTSVPVNGVAFTIVSLHIHPVGQIQSGLATQASVDDLPTNAELATALGTADDVVLAALATVQNDTNDIQTRLPAVLESGRIAAVLDAATLTKINRIEAVATGTVTGAGTSTEVFVGPSATLTITVDSSGNRSAVVVT
jgi:hypothetical protein